MQLFKSGLFFYVSLNVCLEEKKVSEKINNVNNVTCWYDYNNS